MTTRPELRGSFGMVASTHWLASAAGMAVLEQGGNAFDAAVAAGLTLQVVEPHLNGPGGDLPVLVWPAGRDRPLVLCAQGPAPAAATIERYRDDLGLTLIPGTGPLAAVVPGAFGGWLALLREHGTMTFQEVVQYAIHYAENGMRGCSQRTTSRTGSRRGRSRSRSTTTATRFSRPARGARRRSSSSSCACSRASTSRGWARTRRSTSTRSPSARSSRSPIARRGTATPTSSMCRSTCSSRASTRRNGASL